MQINNNLQKKKNGATKNIEKIKDIPKRKRQKKCDCEIRMKKAYIIF